MKVERVEKAAAHARAFLEAHERRYPGLAFETEQERATMIALHRALTLALLSENRRENAA